MVVTADVVCSFCASSLLGLYPIQCRPVWCACCPHVLDPSVMGGFGVPRAPGDLSCASCLGVSLAGCERVQSGVNLHASERGSLGCTGERREPVTLCRSCKHLPKYQPGAWSLACSGGDLEQGPWLRNPGSLLHPMQHGAVGPAAWSLHCCSEAALQPAPIPHRSAAEMRALPVSAYVNVSWAVWEAPQKKLEPTAAKPTGVAGDGLAHPHIPVIFAKMNDLFVGCRSGQQSAFCSLVC